LRCQLRSPWPNLDIDPKDADALLRWHSVVEAPLAHALPDARCPYEWLDPFTRGPPELGKVLGALGEAYAFADFKEAWDFPDDTYFDRWCEERARGRREREDAAAGANATDLCSAGVHEAACATGCGPHGEVREPLMATAGRG